MKMTVNQLMEKLKEIQDKGYGDSKIVINYEYKTEEVDEYGTRSYYKPLEFTNCIDEQVELMEDFDTVSIELVDRNKNK